MTHDEYVTKLDKLLEEYFFAEDVARNDSNDEHLRSAIIAIQQLNNEAIGKDERKSYAGHERLAAKQRNHIRQELRNILGGDK